MIAVAESCLDRLYELYPGLVGTTLIRLQRREKIPIDKCWNKQAVENFVNQIDPSSVISGIASHVDHGGNVGWAIPPGVLVLDADSEESAAWLCTALPDAPRQRTRKGCHVAVKEPKGVDIRQVTQFEIVDGISVDLRTSGSGQIAVEPSIHPTGFAYHWEIELPLDLDTLPSLPDGIVSRLVKAEEAQEPIDISEATWREGSRETRLVSMAGRLRNMSFSEPEVFASLVAMNEQRCRPVLAERDLERIAHSAGKWDRGDDPTKADDPAVAQSAAQGIEGISFSGERLRALTSRPPMAPIYPGIPARGHLNLLIGPSFAGKTTSALWGAMARAAGESPWIGAPAITQGRTLIISPDESVEQVARQILRLSRSHPGGRVFDYFKWITVIGLDITVDPAIIDGLRFDDLGFEVLDDLVVNFDSVVIDAYADMLPLGVSEDSNEDASMIGGRLEAIAIAHNIPITLVHHIGKMRQGTADTDPRDLGRGASALAAKARVISTFEELPDFPNQRRIRTRTNLTIAPAPLDLEVADRDITGTAINYLRPLDPVTAYPIDNFMTDPDEWISTSELARRLTAGESEGRPGGRALQIARTVRAIWHGVSLIEIRQGARNSTEMRRVL